MELVFGLFWENIGGALFFFGEFRDRATVEAHKLAKKKRKRKIPIFSQYMQTEQGSYFNKSFIIMALF